MFLLQKLEWEQIDNGSFYRCGSVLWRCFDFRNTTITCWKLFIAIVACYIFSVSLYSLYLRLIPYCHGSSAGNVKARTRALPCNNWCNGLLYFKAWFWYHMQRHELLSYAWKDIVELFPSTFARGVTIFITTKYIMTHNNFSFTNRCSYSTQIFLYNHVWPSLLTSKFVVTYSLSNLYMVPSLLFPLNIIQRLFFEAIWGASWLPLLHLHHLIISPFQIIMPILWAYPNSLIIMNIIEIS